EFAQCCDTLGERFARLARLARRRFERVVEDRKMFTQCSRRPDAVAERTQIARRAALKGEPRQRPRNIRRAAKIVAQSSTEFVLSHKQSDRVEPRRNFRDI